MSDVIDFDPPQEQQDARVGSAISSIASLNARAVMPDGSTLSRAEILGRLGLNPDTSPTAWLTAIACGSNASALLPGDLQRIAASRISAAASVLQSVQRTQAAGEGQAAQGPLAGGGFESGGRAIG